MQYQPRIHDTAGFVGNGGQPSTMKQNYGVPVAVTLDGEQVEALKEIAQNDGHGSIAALIRAAVALFLHEKAVKDNKASRRGRR